MARLFLCREYDARYDPNRQGIGRCQLYDTANEAAIITNIGNGYTRVGQVRCRVHPKYVARHWDRWGWGWSNAVWAQFTTYWEQWQNPNTNRIEWRLKVPPAKTARSLWLENAPTVR